MILFYFRTSAGFDRRSFKKTISCYSGIMNENFSDTTKLFQQEEIGVDIFQERDEKLAKFEIATLANIFIITVIGNTIVLLALWIRKK